MNPSHPKRKQQSHQPQNSNSNNANNTLTTVKMAHKLKSYNNLLLQVNKSEVIIKSALSSWNVFILLLIKLLYAQTVYLWHQCSVHQHYIDNVSISIIFANWQIVTSVALFSRCLTTNGCSTIINTLITWLIHVTWSVQQSIVTWSVWESVTVKVAYGAELCTTSHYPDTVMRTQNSCILSTMAAYKLVDLIQTAIVYEWWWADGRLHPFYHHMPTRLIWSAKQCSY